MRTQITAGHPLAIVTLVLTERGSASFRDVPTIEAAIDAFLAIEALRPGALERVEQLFDQWPQDGVTSTCIVNAVLGYEA